MMIPVPADEVVRKEEFANLQHGGKVLGGKLALTDHRLIFESHIFGLKRNRAEIPLPDITAIRACWTKFLNLIPLFPDTVAVTTKDGKEYRLVVYERAAWIDAIQKRTLCFATVANS